MQVIKERFTKATVIPSILLFLAVLLSFRMFMVDNNQRISRQNEEYLSDLTEQRAESLENLIRENLSYISTTSYLYGLSLDSPEVDMNLLREFEQSTGFERLRFVSKNGDDYTSEGLAANLSDRDYFKDGIQGNTGVTAVLKSRVTNEAQIGFYSPVYYDNQIIGIMVGFYSEAFVSDLIDFSLFGYEGNAWLCLPDGTVVVQTGSVDSENFLTTLEETSAVSADVLDELRNAFATNSDSLFTYTADDTETSAYLANIEPANWTLIRSFPYQANQMMVANANSEGITLLLSLLVVFTLYFLFQMIRMIRQRKKIMKDARNANDISAGVSKLFEKFTTVDMRTGYYDYISGPPDDKSLPPTGYYDQYCESLLSRIENEEERKEIREFIRLDHLQSLLSKGVDKVSVRVHAPIRGEDWFTFNFVVLEREEDEVTRIMIIRQDVTELRQKEEIEQQALKEALDAAEKANLAKSDFLSNMSHDIRTPMNAIIGFTNIAETHIDDTEKVQDCLDKIHSSSSHLLSLINDILDMSKIESRKIQLHIEENSIRELLTNLSDMVQSQIETKGLNYSVDLSGITHPMIQVDSLRLNQVLLNIVGNAIKYTPEGGSITITASEEELGDHKSSYSFRIKDTGIGMSKSYLPHVFESFTRERSSTVDKIQGTGLGMAISSRIVDLMGGTITVDSELDKGTEFTVTLPIEYTDHEDNRNTSHQDDAIRELSFEGKKLLLVEDNDINAEIAKFILDEHGFAIDRAENGQAAVNRLKEVGPAWYDLVLMDIQMPVMNGYEATRAIRAMDGFQSLPIIAMTANTFEDDKKEARAAGMNAHVAKPFEVETLLKTLGEYLSS
ncbi:MAG: response regulator [Solobacterium sp.]|nr:response regulator [Solobacterium sp.]